MIESIIALVYTFVLRALLFLPDAPSSMTFVTSAQTASGYISSVNQFFPISELLILLGVFIIFETVYFGYKIIYWIIKKIPTVS